MRLGLDIRNGATDEELIIARQFGAVDAVGGPDCIPSDKGYFDFHELVVFKQRVEDFGLRLAALENVPWDWNDKIKLGLPGRDEQIENYQRSIKNAGSAGIPILGYNFRPPVSGNYGVRTSKSALGRGGAQQTSFDYDLIRNEPAGEWGEITASEMWNNLEYFLKAVIPIAEESGVTMALHPDDPPASQIGGVTRILNSHDGLKHLIDLVPSDSNALDFCQGSVSVMEGDVHDAIRYFGSRGKIAYVHFRNVTARFPKFAETFIDEGYVDMAAAMAVYKEAGFDGPVIEDHVPVVAGDDPKKLRSHAFAMGYTKALIDSVYGRR